MEEMLSLVVAELLLLVVVVELLLKHRVHVKMLHIPIIELGPPIGPAMMSDIHQMDPLGQYKNINILTGPELLQSTKKQKKAKKKAC
jgi:hypothetical protein